jgi:hypothetical protein
VESLPLPLLVVLIVAAVIAGLWLGNRAGKALPPDRRDGKPAKPIGARIRGAATDGIVKLWKWNRARKKEAEKKRG